MLFNSFAFAIFLPFVFIIYWALPKKYQWLVLLISSCYFYASWNAKYIFLIFFTTAISYLCAILIEAHRAHAKRFLLLALVACLGVLILFKYFNFISINVVRFLQFISIPVHPMTLRLMLPVGISFYTFQTLSYVIDVYRGTIPAEKHFGKYATFVTFFPQLVAGPIERTNNLLTQIKAPHSFNYDGAVQGVKMMAWGLFKKIVIADNLAFFVDLVYGNVQDYGGIALLVATAFFAVQIYCDFSGYSDIAIGVSRLFGIKLMTNFSSPYFSSSLEEFWRRWHISLSTWFRDYVYIPLGGNRKGKTRTSINLILTFLLSGLWHGANWTFVIWGTLHGVLQVIEKRLRKHFPGFIKSRLINTSIVFCVVSACWVFFRAETVGDALFVFGHCFSGIANIGDYISKGIVDLQLDAMLMLKIAVPIMILCTYDHLSLRHDVLEMISRKSPFVRWLL